MKKAAFFFAAFVLLMGVAVQAEDLQVGMTASDWSFVDSEKKVFSMASWAGKVLLVNYVDPDESDLNEHFTDAMKKAKDDGRLMQPTRASVSPTVPRPGNPILRSGPLRAEKRENIKRSSCSTTTEPCGQPGDLQKILPIWSCSTRTGFA